MKVSGFIISLCANGSFEYVTPNYLVGQMCNHFVVCQSFSFIILWSQHILWANWQLYLVTVPVFSPLKRNHVILPNQSLFIHVSSSYGSKSSRELIVNSYYCLPVVSASSPFGAEICGGKSPIFSSCVSVVPVSSSCYAKLSYKPINNNISLCVSV